MIGDIKIKDSVICTETNTKNEKELTLHKEYIVLGIKYSRLDTLLNLENDKEEKKYYSADLFLRKGGFSKEPYTKEELEIAHKWLDETKFRSDIRSDPYSFIEGMRYYEKHYQKKKETIKKLNE